MLSIQKTPNQNKLVDIWEILKRTHHFICKNGGDAYSWESVLQILDPPVLEEPEEYKKQRMWLHTALSRDPTPYQFNLAMCEAWLRLHHIVFGMLKRGGPRPNTGGPRAGAVRKRRTPV